MADLRLSHPSKVLRGALALPGSKSENNRLLILRALYAPHLELKGESNSRDSRLLRNALDDFQHRSEIDVQDAGTAMRFLTAFLAMQPQGEWVLKGSARMHERPIGVLVDALKSLDAKVEYLGKEGYPPLRIEGTEMKGGELWIDASLSSQFISALMMIAPRLEGGLSLKFKGASVSAPYIYLTASIMRQWGFKVVILGDEVRVPEQSIKVALHDYQVEPDWSAASYWFSALAIAEKGELYLPGFKEISFQGDSVLGQFYAPLGVEQIFIGSGIRLRKTNSTPVPKQINLLANPDLAQSLAPAYAALGKQVQFKGLQTLKLKETDRLVALGQELAKFGMEPEISDSSFLVRGKFSSAERRIKTYQDHRMAMGFMPLALLQPLIIEDAEVVEKSYPGFWDDCRKLGFKVEEL